MESTNPPPEANPAANGASTTRPPREHFWDTLRAVLMLLGIPYHVALSYMVGRQWIVKSGEGVPGFIELARFISLFRMPAFYLIAGYFAAMLLARRAPGTWLEGRFRRLGIPFVTSIVLLVPALNWFCEISNLPFGQAVESWIDNSSKSGGYWVRHLWVHYRAAVFLLRDRAAGGLEARFRCRGGCRNGRTVWWGGTWWRRFCCWRPSSGCGKRWRWRRSTFGA